MSLTIMNIVDDFFVLGRHGLLLLRRRCAPLRRVVKHRFRYTAHQTITTNAKKAALNNNNCRTFHLLGGVVALLALHRLVSGVVPVGIQILCHSCGNVCDVSCLWVVFEGVVLPRRVVFATILLGPFTLYIFRGGN